jgi:hypothetical protein
MSFGSTFGLSRAALTLAFVALGAGGALADRIKNPTAVFSGLDKITGRIVSFEVGVGETVQFGSLQMTPQVCYTKPPTENPNTTTFVEVDDTEADGTFKRVFSGWMFASSPGLHGMEHPVYDLWLVNCKGGTEVIAEPKDAPEALPPVEPANASPRSPTTPNTTIIAPGGTAPPVGAVERTPIQPPAQRRPPRRVVPAPTNEAPLINNDRPND